MNSNVVIKMVVMLSNKLLNNFVNVIAHINFGVLKACNKINWGSVFPLNWLNRLDCPRLITDNITVKERLIIKTWGFYGNFLMT